MNYHIEHHMYPRVPCYHLASLHEAIKHDLPPTPNGIYDTWRILIGVMKKLRDDPSYVLPVELPANGGNDGETATTPLLFVVREEARSGDGSLAQVGIRTYAKHECMECRQKFDTEKALDLHWRFIHDPGRHQED